MSRLTRENLKRLFGKPVSSANEDGDITLLSDIISPDSPSASGTVNVSQYRVETTSPIIATINDDFLFVNITDDVEPQVFLPTDGNPQLLYVIDKKGNAATRNIVLFPDSGDTISGAASGVINADRGSLTLFLVNNDWSVI